MLLLFRFSIDCELFHYRPNLFANGATSACGHGRKHDDDGVVPWRVPDKVTKFVAVETDDWTFC